MSDIDRAEREVAEEKREKRTMRERMITELTELEIDLQQLSEAAKALPRDLPPPPEVRQGRIPWFKR